MSTEMIVGIAASIGTGISLVPQLAKVLKEKKAENVSFGMMIILFAGLGLWIYYGILKADVIIIASNAFSFTINVLLTIAAFKYKKGRN